MRPLSASLGFGGAGFAGADGAPPPDGDEEQSAIAKTAPTVRSVFQNVIIGANNNLNFSSQIGLV